MVNYFEWSMEYKNTADSIQDVIDRLKAEKRGKSGINKKELDLKSAMNAFTFQIILWIDITEYDKMKREFIHITDNNKHRLMSDSGFWHGSTNENSRDKMKKILSMAVLNELTERQRICIVDYYLNGKKAKEIAKELGVNSSTVSRHIMKARDKLRHIASYYVN